MSYVYEAHLIYYPLKSLMKHDKV